MKNYYKILETHPNATGEELKSAYRKCAKKYHPDAHQIKQEYYHSLIVEINEAYAVLSNKIQRKNYDLKYTFFYSTSPEGFVVVNEEIFKPKETIDIVEILRTIPFFKNKFEINNEFIKWKKQHILIKEICKVKFGLDSFLISSYSLFLSFEIDSTKIYYLNFSESFVPEDYLVEKYKIIINLITYYLIPSCLSRIIAQLDDGKTFMISESVSVARIGLIIKDRNFKVIKWQNLIITEITSNYYSYKYVSNYILTDALNKTIKEKVKPHKDWNACLIPSIRNFYLGSNLVKTE